jgi:hypothetical protein
VGEAWFRHDPSSILYSKRGFMCEDIPHEMRALLEAEVQYGTRRGID